MKCIMKEAKTTTQPQPLSGGFGGSPLEEVLSTSPGLSAVAEATLLFFISGWLIAME